MIGGRRSGVVVDGVVVVLLVGAKRLEVKLSSGKEQRRILPFCCFLALVISLSPLSSHYLLPHLTQATVYVLLIWHYEVGLNKYLRTKAPFKTARGGSSLAITPRITTPRRDAAAVYFFIISSTSSMLYS